MAMSRALKISRSLIQGVRSYRNDWSKTSFSTNVDRRAWPLNDFAFKEVFNNESILKSFLNDTLPIDEIKRINYENVEFDRKTELGKSSKMDVVCRLDDEQLVIVEMQVLKEKDFLDRIFNYACRAYTAQVKKGHDYDDALPVILLAICNFNLFPRDVIPKFISDHRVTHTESNNVFFNQIRLVVLELPKFVTEPVLPVDYWALFLKHAHEFDDSAVRSIKKKKPIIGSAIDALEYHSWTEEKQLAYDRVQFKHSAAGRAYEEGKEEGKEEIKIEMAKKMREIKIEMAKKMREIKIEMAKKMLADGRPIDEICKYTGLNKEDFTQ